MIALRDKSKCTGCTACAAACPMDCISMKVGTGGFLYPEIDGSRCVSCGKCERACPVDHIAEIEEDTMPKAYGAQANDLGLRLSSSSGGVFSLLAEEVLNRGGVVFGAAMSADCKSVHHVMAEDRNELALLRGSKYVPSDLEDTFRRVKEELKRRSVLFTGTPCQVDGLTSYLGGEEEKLLCAEVICHGVPAPELWRMYIENLNAQSGSEATKVEFRNKDSGWKHYTLKVKRSDSVTMKAPTTGRQFMKLFLRDLCLRPSCYQCPSKGLNRTADLTIGDFWGVESVAPELDDDRGTSLVLVHTRKGQAALEQVLPETTWKEVDCMAALCGNPAMMRSAKCPENREAFVADMERLPFLALAEKYVPGSRRDKLIDLVKNLGLMPWAIHLNRALRQK